MLRAEGYLHTAHMSQYVYFEIQPLMCQAKGINKVQSAVKHIHTSFVQRRKCKHTT